VYVLKGRIASTDDEAARAIASELRELLDEMKSGIGAGNVEAARDAASRAVKMGQMLDDEAAGKVKRAIDEVREVAKAVVKRMSGGEAAAEIVKTIKLEALEAARFAFIDVSDNVEVESLPPAEARALDLSDDDDDEVTSEGEAVRGRFDLDEESEPRMSAAPTAGPEIEV
jgi:hypothetical protein